MKELIYLGSDCTELNDKTYNISTFIDVFNYEILRGTNLNTDKLKKGDKVMCDLDVKYNKKKNKFVFFVSKISE